MLNKQRQNNRVLVDFFVTLLVSFTFIGILIFPILSNVWAISIKKEEFNNLYTSYSDLLTKWLRYSNWQTEYKWKESFISLLNKDKNLDIYSKKILTYNKLQSSWITEKDYNKFLEDFKWWKFKTFKEFSDFKKIELNNEESKTSNDKLIIWKILPKYDDNLNLSWEKINNVLSNITFVNNIEKILTKYNLTTDSKIWISQIVEVKKILNNNIKNKKAKKSDKKIETGLYYIPVKLDLEWDKKDIIAFLKELKTFWNLYMLSVKDEWSDEEVNKLHYKNNNWDYIYIWDKIKWKDILRKPIESYHQLLNIESIEMWDYIDDATVKNNDTLLESINNKQIDDSYKLVLNLQFYVSWISDRDFYISLKQITWIISDIELIKWLDKIQEKEKEKKKLETREKLILDYYNKSNYGKNDDDYKDLWEYNKLKIRIIKYLKILEKDTTVNNLWEIYVKKKIKILKNLKEKLVKEYFDKDLWKILKDLKTASNIRVNYKKIEDYIYKFSLIEAELDSIHDNLY